MFNRRTRCPWFIRSARLDWAKRRTW